MTALEVLGTLLAIGVCTALMFFGIFMKYVHTTLEPVLDVDMSAITLNQSSVIYYQDKSTGEWKELQKIHGTEDRFVPIEMTYRNYRACTAQKRLVVVPGARHAMSYYVDPAACQRAMKAFWKDFDLTE